MSEQKRQEILHSSIHLFAEKGYTETTVRDIARACKLQASSLYNYVSGKQELLDEIIRMYTQNTANVLDEQALRTMAKQGKAREALQSLFFSFPGEDAALYKEILKIFLQEQYRNPVVGRYMKEEYIGGVRDAIKQLLDLLMDEGALGPVDSAVYANLFVSLNVAATIESGFHTAEEIGQEDNLYWERSLRFLVEQLLETAPKPNGQPADS